MELTQDEKNRIYQEEKARLEAKKLVNIKENFLGGIIGLVLFIAFMAFIWHILS